jgi:hypothetical protein
MIPNIRKNNHVPNHQPVLGPKRIALSYMLILYTANYCNLYLDLDQKNNQMHLDSTKKVDLDNIYIYNFMHHDSYEHANINPHGSMIPHHLMDSLPSFPTASQVVPEQPKDCQGFFGLVIPENLPQIPATKRGILITMISYNMIISLYHGLYHYSYHDIPSL